MELLMDYVKNDCYILVCIFIGKFEIFYKFGKSLIKINIVLSKFYFF